jgi:hypothetical protein
MAVSDSAASGALTSGLADGRALAEGGALDLAAAPELAAFRREMYTRTSLDRLPAHLEERHGVEVSGLSELDLGVYRVRRADGDDWVARVFPAARPASGAGGDAELLRFVSEGDVPAERCAVAEPVSELDGQAVLVTGFVPGVPRERRRAAIAQAGDPRALAVLQAELDRLAAAVRARPVIFATWGFGMGRQPVAAAARDAVAARELGEIIAARARAAFAA